MTANLTDFDYEEPEPTPEMRILDCTIYVLISLLTVLGSALVIHVFRITSALQEVSGYLMVSVTCVDLCTCIVVVMPAVYSSATLHIPWSGTWLCHFQAIANPWLTNFKAFLIMLCAMDRGISILYPLKYNRYIRPRVFVVSATVSALICCVMPIYMHTVLDYAVSADMNSGMCWSFAQGGNMLPYYFNLLINNVIPGLIVLVCYGAIVAVVFKQRQVLFAHKRETERTYQPSQVSRVDENAVAAVAPADSQNNLDSKRPSSSLRESSTRATQGILHASSAILSHLGACRMLFIVTMLYFLGFLPVVIADHYFARRETLLWYHLCNCLMYANLWANFPVYYRMNKTFKHAVHKLMKRKRNTDAMLMETTNTQFMDQSK